MHRKLVFSLGVLVLLALGTSGCVKTKTKEVAVPLLQSEQLVAESNEQREEYQEALRYWKSARSVVDQKIGFLANRLKEIASDYPSCEDIASEIVLIERKLQQPMSETLSAPTNLRVAP